MKRLEQFLTNYPSYCKCGNEKIANASGISINTISRFKRSDRYKTINKNYRSKL
jgi:uncharacterized protein YerC